MPLDDATIELINSVIDGEASADERARLQSILAERPEAQRMFEATQELAGRLDSAVRTETPPGMRREIMGLVERGVSVSHADHPARTRASGPHRASSTRRVWFGLGWAAAAALVVAVAILAPMRLIGRRSAAEAGATMAPQTGYDWPIVATIRSRTADAQLIARRDGDLTALECTIVTPQTVVVSVTWDNDAASAVAISAARDASSSKGQFSFTVQPGSGRTSVIVRRRSGTRSLDVGVSVDSKQVIRAAVPLG